MFSDYRSFGICETDFAQSNQVYTADRIGVNGGVEKGWMHLNAIADSTLTLVTFNFDRNTEGAQPYTITLKAGCQLAAVASFTMGTGQVQVLYFKS